FILFNAQFAFHVALLEPFECAGLRLLLSCRQRHMRICNRMKSSCAMMQPTHRPVMPRPEKPAHDQHEKHEHHEYMHGAYSGLRGRTPSRSCVARSMMSLICRITSSSAGHLTARSKAVCA